MVFPGAYLNINPKAKPRVRVTLGLNRRFKIFFIQISFKDKSLKEFAKTNLLHLGSSFNR